MVKKGLNKRQDRILEILGKRGKLRISEIINEIKTVKNISKVTVNRDLKELIQLGYVIVKGKARASAYELSAQYSLIMPIDIDRYFKEDPDKREARKSFDFNIFAFLKNSILLDDEKVYIEALNKEYKANIEKIFEIIKKKESERLTVELSWKSSRIEGNTYTLLETEALIKSGKEAKGHEKKEVIMILNHKKVLDHIVNNKAGFREINIRDIKDIHYLLIKDLGISRNLRKTAVGITGTKYVPLDNEHQIREAMEKMCYVVNALKNPFAKALTSSILIAYIQPFEDGNKRTSRLAANAILIAHDMCPLSYREVDEVEYKKAVILFYEQNNINYFKQLFIEQFEFAVKHYFRA